jgi:hypothetical protein
VASHPTLLEGLMIRAERHVASQFYATILSIKKP